MRADHDFAEGTLAEVTAQHVVANDEAFLLVLGWWRLVLSVLIITVSIILLLLLHLFDVGVLLFKVNHGNDFAVSPLYRLWILARCSWLTVCIVACTLIGLYVLLLASSHILLHLLYELGTRLPLLLADLAIVGNFLARNP